MSLISIRLNDKLLDEVKAKAQTLHVSKTEYIRRAIELMNEEVKKQEIKKKLIEASLRVRNNSMSVNEDFSRIEHDPED